MLVDEVLTKCSRSECESFFENTRACRLGPKALGRTGPDRIWSRGLQEKVGEGVLQKIGGEMVVGREKEKVDGL